MLFTVLCTYYDKTIFNRHAQKSILEQDFKVGDVEFLTIDNSNGQFSSAGQAYNDKAFGAKGEYLIFVHQDVSLLSPNWLTVLTRLVNACQFGIAGCSGVSASGQRLGFIKDRKTIWGRPFCSPEEAQTIDESIMIIPKSVFVALGGFDPSLGWNSYGTDLSLKCLEQKMKVLVLPLFLWHDSPSVLRGIEKVLWQIKSRYGQAIQTTSGSTRSRSLIKNSLKSCLPPAVKGLLVKCLSAIGREKEENVLSYKLRQANRIAIFDILPENCPMDLCIIPTKVKLERLSNNPIWLDKSIELFVARNGQELRTLLRAIEPLTVALINNDLIPYLAQQNDLQTIQFSEQFSVIKGTAV
ncbi:glycosyltransferase family 2 protein [Candidatus Margulisiibacteriota bacterium]